MMIPDKTQLGVARGMALALVTAVVLFVVAALYLPRLCTFGSDVVARIQLAGWAIVSPALVLLICVARLAKHRFFTAEDINGSALTTGSERARLLQSLLQNTLEQMCLAIPVYVATSVIAPDSLLPLVPAAAAMFFVGRLSFFAGYAKGAPSRAFGFALTFYPTGLLLGLLLVLGVQRALS